MIIMRNLKLVLAAAAGSLLFVTPALASGSTITDTSAEDNRIVCKKALETGSLVRKNKQCFTQAEWDRIAESQRRGAEQLVHDLATKKGDGN